MPEELPITGAAPTPELAAKNNAAVAEALKAQDAMGQSTSPSPDAAAGDSLDALAKAAEKAHEEKVEPVVEKKVEAAPAAKTPEEIAADTAAAQAAAAALEENKKKADEFFKDSPSLAPNASPKSSEAFTAVKIKAAQEISAREQEIARLKKLSEEQAEKLKNPVPDEVAKELEDHRKWRAKMDIDSDPKFKEFDKTIASTQDFIYAQLKRSPVITDETIAQIKKHGGPENVKMDKIFAAINDPTMQQIIQSKLADIEMAKFSKQQAVEAAKNNVTEYMQQREKAVTEGASNHNKQTEAEFSNLLKQVDWFKEQTPPANADEATKKGIAAHNEFVATTRKQLTDALADDSPGMRATMLVGMAQLFRLQKIVPVIQSQLAETKKQLAEATEKLEKVKKASVSHIRESNAAPGATVVPAKTDLTRPAGDSLDAIRDQIMADRAATGK